VTVQYRHGLSVDRMNSLGARKTGRVRVGFFFPIQRNVGGSTKIPEIGRVETPAMPSSARFEAEDECVSSGSAELWPQVSGATTSDHS
jgi:hypothetical protein